METCSECPDWGQGTKPPKKFCLALNFSLKHPKAIQMQAWKVAFIWSTLQLNGQDVS